MKAEDFKPYVENIAESVKGTSRDLVVDESFLTLMEEVMKETGLPLSTVFWYVFANTTEVDAGDENEYDLM